jgi:hypothetical protein
MDVAEKRKVAKAQQTAIAGAQAAEEEQMRRSQAAAERAAEERAAAEEATKTAKLASFKRKKEQQQKVRPLSVSTFSAHSADAPRSSEMLDAHSSCAARLSDRKSRSLTNASKPSATHGHHSRSLSQKPSALCRPGTFCLPDQW